VTGNESHPRGRFVDVEKFDQALEILLKNHLINRQTIFCLYNWGEPTLHPQFEKILAILRTKYRIQYELSTNAGKFVEYQPEWFENLSHLRISMCGFSQESYDKIHQFDFEKVKSNIVSIVQAAKKSRYNTQKIELAHHIYQFNIHEVPALREFARKLKVYHNPHFAYIGDPKMARAYYNNSLNSEVLKEISQNIFCYYLQKRREQHPRNDCKLWDDLTIDENCDILTCCGIERDHPNYRIANVFDENLMQTLKEWRPKETCFQCMKLGMSSLRELPNAFSFPMELNPPPKLSFFHRIKAKGKQIETAIRHKIRYKKYAKKNQESK
jgi:hypothetical protein